MRCLHLSGNILTKSCQEFAQLKYKTGLVLPVCEPLRYRDIINFIGISLQSTSRCYSPTRYQGHSQYNCKPCSLLLRLPMHHLPPSHMRLEPFPRKSFARTSLHCLGNTSLSATSRSDTIQSWHGLQHDRSIPRRSTCRSSHKTSHPSPSDYCICHQGYSLEGKDFSNRALCIPHNTSHIQTL